MLRGLPRIGGAILAAGCASPALVATATAAHASATTDVCASTQAIQIDALAFQPQFVSPGQASQATLSAENCTAQPQSAGAQWYARFIGPSGAIPPGCLAYDPLVLPMNLPAGGRLDSTVRYWVPGSCTAGELLLTVKIIQNGTVVAQRGAQLAIEQPYTG